MYDQMFRYLAVVNDFLGNPGCCAGGGYSISSDGNGSFKLIFTHRFPLEKSAAKKFELKTLLYSEEIGLDVKLSIDREPMKNIEVTFSLRSYTPVMT